jgi:hypothetical protein
VFGIVLVMGLVGGRTAFLNDPGTFWHIELGRQIWQTGEVPRADVFTYSREGKPWVDQSWAFDLGLSALYDHWGWSGAVAATALGLAWIYGSLARGLCKDGHMPLVAGVVAVLVAGVGSIHFLTRPHLFTFAFVLWTLRVCQSFHEKGGKSIWLVPLGMALWANLHGGFLAGPVIVATAAFGHAVSSPLDAERKRRLRVFAAVFVLSCLAPIANPYGLGLYRHVLGLLFSSGVTKMIDEYQPSPFGKFEVMVLEWFILAFVALPAFSKKRASRYQVLHILVWLHFALGAVRQAPLFAIVAAGGLATLLCGLLSPSENRERDEAGGHWSAWPVLTSLIIAMSVCAGVTWGKLDPALWPTQAVARLNQQPTATRLFHEQDWGGMIEAECRPRRRTYMDDRFELYGKQAIVDYLDALAGGPGWDRLLDREQFGLVWVRPERGVSQRLDKDPEWEVVFRDKVSVLYRRRQPDTGDTKRAANYVWDRVPKARDRLVTALDQRR